ncbi:hypothetical protein Acor_79000 [Acrocarpospora corrugata]|uniref:Fenitrothion hydrolase n=1 Tax=Acrocarpospora corrugata TaxID=35763 RepID=A0A5M3WFJ4_9ACTN|nr:hypothetical protein [Acrocarpospora corrugata]GES05831.1 hypothetical protein Acor_79000 [Acrocarpospora corrugata]
MFLAHGVGGRQDLPIPFAGAVAGAVIALLVSFAALGFLWREPRLAGIPSYVIRSSARIPQIIGLVVAAYFSIGLLFGPDTPENPTAGVFYVLFWVGLVPLSLVFGPVWRNFNPLRTLHRVACALLRRDPNQGWKQLSPRVGYWPATIGLLAFVWLELVAPARATLPVISIWLSLYALTTLTGAAIYGASWFDKGDAFEAYSTLIGSLSVAGFLPPTHPLGRSRSATPTNTRSTQKRNNRTTTPNDSPTAIPATSGKKDRPRRSIPNGTPSAISAASGKKDGSRASAPSGSSPAVPAASGKKDGSRASAPSGSSPAVSAASGKRGGTRATVPVGSRPDKQRVSHDDAREARKQSSDQSSAATGKLIWRNPLDGMAGLAHAPGLPALVIVLLGSTMYDSLSNAPIWVRFVQDSSLPAPVMGTFGLLVVIGLVLALFLAATTWAGRLGGSSPATTAGELAHSLVPIAVGYLIAHYFSLFLFEGQHTLALLSDPLDTGANWLGTANWTLQSLGATPASIAMLQVTVIVIGHVLGTVLAHDRALTLFPRRTAVLGQIPLMTLMVIYTVAGLLLLFAG